MNLLTTKEALQHYITQANEATDTWYKRYERATQTPIRSQVWDNVKDLEMSNGLAEHVHQLPYRQRHRLYQAYMGMYELTSWATPLTGREFRNMSLDEVYECVEALEDLITEKVRRTRKTLYGQNAAGAIE